MYITNPGTMQYLYMHTDEQTAVFAITDDEFFNGLSNWTSVIQLLEIICSKMPVSLMFKYCV